MVFIKYLLSVSIGLLVLIAVEFMLTMGAVLQFSQYNIIGWVFQILLIIATVCFSIIIVYEELKNKNKGYEKETIKKVH